MQIVAKIFFLDILSPFFISISTLPLELGGYTSKAARFGFDSYEESSSRHLSMTFCRALVFFQNHLSKRLLINAIER